MAVKYKRDEDLTTTRDRLANAYAPRFLPTDPKQRLVIIYLGLLAATLMLLAAYGLGIFNPASSAKIEEGIVAVESKRTVQSDDGALIYIIEVTADLAQQDGTRSDITAPAAIDEAAWNRIQPGAFLNARYRWEPETGTLTIHALDETTN